MIEYVLLLSLFTLVAIPGVARLRDGTEDQTKQTSVKIGGQPVGTTPPPTTRVPPTTTAPPPPTTAAPLPQIDAGPDQRVRPGVAFTQTGSFRGPGAPIYPGQDYWWTDAPAVSSSAGPLVGSLENFTSSMTWTVTKPGFYTMYHYANSTAGWVSDTALLKVTSGAIDNPFTAIDVYPGWSSPSTTWDVQFGISLMNSFGQPVPDITVTVRLTLSDGSTRNLTCVSVASGWCGAWVTLPKALTPSSGVITAMSGACLDTYTIPPPVRWSGGLMAWPTTTTAPPTTSTTTTSTTSTSTTAPPTTTPATTTTRRGPNG